METILILLSIQGFIGAYDSIYHHEIRERLSLRPSAAIELKIHSLRSTLYCVLFLSFGWIEWHGLLALLFAFILIVELALTLWDFVVEDQTRDLPYTERITHTILGLNFGAILALLVPELLRWYDSPTNFVFINHGMYSWIMTLYGIGVIPFAIKEYTSYRTLSLGIRQRAKTSIATPPSIQRKNILITGGTGFIGQALCKTLLDQGHSLTLVARDFKKAVAVLDASKRITLISAISQLKNTDIFDIIINLAGEPIANGRWSQHKKQLIMDSRINTTRQILRYIKEAQQKPALLISGSAIGYYGPRDDEAVTESSNGVDSFSHTLCAQWETQALEAEQLGVRVCLLRTGIVLGKSGGALAAMLIPFSYGLGGQLGDGRQWMSWIHIDDMVGIILKTIENNAITGPVNATAPNPVSNKVFTKTLGSVLHRPTIMTVPAFILRLLLGDLADELFLTGQKVIPQKITDNGYQFQHPTIRDALENIIREK